MTITKSISYSYEIQTGCGILSISFKYVNGKIRMSMNMGKSGGCASSQIDAIERLINLMLENGVSPYDIEKTLVGIHCSVPYLTVNSCADAIAKIFKEVSLIHENEEGSYV